ncbi:MAG: energy-coupling factor transporter transmembrane protein EcfT [Streptococcaceae bacterium]|jgi:energy-coupling factor transport system permease protein|nr:energy-coupling factor transporter transmembrane protein EcfT [Streptococcaceae bacterium]
MRQTLSLYVPGNSFVHKVSPLTKLLFVMVVVISSYLLSSLPSLGVLFLLPIVLLLAAGVFRRTLPIYLVSLLAILTILIVQGMSYTGNHTLAFELGVFSFYQEGLVFAGRICLRLLILISAFSLIIFTVDPEELVSSTVRIGLSPRLGYVILSVFQIIPQMMTTVATITDAQRSRGMKTSGNVIARLKGIFPLIGPAVMNSLIATRERSMALEVRAFSRKGQHSFIREQRKYLGGKVLPVCLWLCLAAVIAWRIFEWLR